MLRLGRHGEGRVRAPRDCAHPSGSPSSAACRRSAKIGRRRHGRTGDASWRFRPARERVPSRRIPRPRRSQTHRSCVLLACAENNVSQLFSSLPSAQVLVAEALRRHQLPQTVGRTPSRPAQARATTRSVSRRSPPAPRAPGAHAFSLTALRLTAALCRTARHYPWKEELQARQKKPPGREIAMYTLMFLAVPGPSASTADALDKAFPAKAFGVNLTESCTLCRVRAGRSFGSVRRAAARRQWVVKPSIASMRWVVLWPACRPGVPLPRTARPLGCAVSRGGGVSDVRCDALRRASKHLSVRASDSYDGIV